MKIAYFDCFAGASGDMILGALVDAGLSLELLKKEIAGLGLKNYHITAQKVLKNGIAGTQVLVTADQDVHRNHHRRLSHIIEIIEKSSLSDAVKQKSGAVFQRMAEAEAKVHGIGIEDVHFHEVGAMDAIIDVVGAAAGLACLGIEKIFCSPLHTGTGTVKCAHGILPVPAPATAELIKGIPVYSTGVKGELLTPTGAAILTSLVSEFGTMPPMIPESAGYGAGTSEREIPNLLRLITGSYSDGKDYETEQALVMEANIDDMNPQIYDYLIQKILDIGANDVFLTPVQMKKNRPGILLTIICSPAHVDIFSDFLLRETTTIGLRYRLENRIKAGRIIKTVKTKYGDVRVKIAQDRKGVSNISPEYEDCKKIALEKQLPLKSVLEYVWSEMLKD